MAPLSAPSPGGKGGGTSSTLLQTRLDNLWGGGLADRPLLRITFRAPRNSRAISRVGTNRLPRSPLRCIPTCHFHFSLATRWRTIHPGLHVNLPIAGRNTPGFATPARQLFHPGKCARKQLGLILSD